MAKQTIEIDDRLFQWACEAAAREGLSFEAYVELLLGVESGLLDAARDGRRINAKSFIYRDADRRMLQPAQGGT